MTKKEHKTLLLIWAKWRLSATTLRLAANNSRSPLVMLEKINAAQAIERCAQELRLILDTKLRTRNGGN